MASFVCRVHLIQFGKKSPSEQKEEASLEGSIFGLRVVVGHTKLMGEVLLVPVVDS